jgi:hypothetical protein
MTSLTEAWAQATEFGRVITYTVICSILNYIRYCQGAFDAPRAFLNTSLTVLEAVVFATIFIILFTSTKKP